MNREIYTITEINKYIKEIFARDVILNNLWLTGEISNFHHHSSGHMYFTLKDDDSAISAVMFRGNNRNLGFEIEDGMKVIAHGYISIYEVRGTYQFYVEEMEPAGIGALYLAYEQLKEKLEKEGLFAVEHKKAIPLLPKKIGIVTSPTGAAIRDILSVIRRRFPNIYVLIVPSLVQGEDAAPQIVRGIDYLNRRGDIDLIIVSRGGGSIEDLWPFNEEIVARAVFNSKVPVISGIGHETDFTITDFAADLRAPTPSAAAELAISSRLELEKQLDNLEIRLLNGIRNKLEYYRKIVESLAEKRAFTKPEELLSEKSQRIDELARNLEWNMEKRLGSLKESFKIISGKLESLSPLKTLARGYSITGCQGAIIKSIEDVNPGDLIRTIVHDGEIKSRVLEKASKKIDY
ncbi:MAG: exodeoxyribonuclease VII large subunit [Halanaerobiaceae bacterium]|nr:exodeoxyribonuclease VII large subunit [Halanaerobiaceae bacterium]